MTQSAIIDGKTGKYSYDKIQPKNRMTLTVEELSAIPKFHVDVNEREVPKCQGN